MRRRLPFLLMGGLCAAWLLMLCLTLNESPGKLLFNADEEMYESLATHLAADETVAAFASYCRMEAGLIQDGDQRRAMACTEVLIWGDYVPPWPADMLAGKWPDATEAGMAVISGEQASRLFAGYDCIGETVLLNGRICEVAGVYRKRGVAARLSAMGASEAFVVADMPQSSWVVSSVKGKENQAGYSVMRFLEEAGATDEQPVLLYRQRDVLLFALELEGLILLLLVGRGAWRRIGRGERKAHPFIGKALGLLAGGACLVFCVKRFPWPAEMLPVSLRLDAVAAQLNSALIRWNTTAVPPTAEGCFQAWMGRIAAALSVLFWLCLRRGSRATMEG